jgi:hypothetical protein
MDQGKPTLKSGTEVARAVGLLDTGRKQQGRINIPLYSGALCLRLFDILTYRNVISQESVLGALKFKRFVKYRECCVC